MSRAGPSPITSTLSLTPCARRRVDRVGEHVEALFQHQPAEEGDDHVIVGDAVRGAKVGAAPVGIELRAVDAARPDRDVAVHALGAQDGGGRFGGRDERVAAAVEAAQDRAHGRLEPLEVIICEIGVEARVDRGDDRDVARPRPADRAVRDDVGAGDVDDVGGEGGEVAAHADAGCAAAGDIRAAREWRLAGTLTTSPTASKAGSSTVGE